MKRERLRYDPMRAAKRKLQVALLIFFGALAVPLFLLVLVIQGKLETEAYDEYRGASEELLGRLDQRIGELLQVEDQRPFGDYGFVRVVSNQLLAQQALGYSPLSQYPPKSEIPGLIGYFQVNPDGSFQTPFLPEVLDGSLAGLGLSQTELQKRLELQKRIRSLLKGEGGLLIREKIDFRYPDKPTKDAGGVFEPGNDALSLFLVSRAYAQSEESAVNSTQSISPERLKKDYNIDQRFWQKNYAPKQSAPAVKKSVPNSFRYRGKSRQETVTIPQKMEGLKAMDSFFGGKTTQKSLGEPQVKSQAAVKEKSSAADMDISDSFNSFEEQEGPGVDAEKVLPVEKSEGAKGRVTEDFITFESEIEPLRFRVLENGIFVFHRKVWKDKQRYLQGFLCDGRQFVEEIVKRTFLASRIGSVSTLIVAHGGEALWRFEPQQKRLYSLSYRSGAYDKAQSEKRILIFRDFLGLPLDTLELLFTAPSLPTPFGAYVVYGLTFVISGVLLLGGGGLYFLGLKQISLAKERSNFVSAVSHELKTPLTSIRMYAEMLRADWVQSPEKIKSYYDFIFFESERLSRLITNVLQLSRLGNDQHSLDVKSYTLAELLELARGKVLTQIEASGFALDVLPCDGVDEAQTIQIDEDAMSSIVINLVDNAIKFSSDAERKVVEVGVRGAGAREVVFFVRDFGPGVSKEKMKKIFRLFYRGQDEMTRSTSGTGIGLALVSELAARMSASVDLQNRNPGAEFQVRFRVIPV